jgi:molybdopterin-guanine dinucleotide biosynthesis protein B
VWRAATGEGMLHPNDPHIVAVASDAKIDTRLPVLDLNDDAAVGNFVLDYLKLR